MTSPRLIVACETSGRVRDAFRRRGINAISCDLLPTDRPGPHWQKDIRRINLRRTGIDGLIAFPPCTYLCSSGLHWNHRIPGRAARTEDALELVQWLFDAMTRIGHGGLENPTGCISTRIRPYDQRIQPWQFGHDASKGTCLWLIGLPALVPTKVVSPHFACRNGHRLKGCLAQKQCRRCGASGRTVWANQTASGQNRLPPSAERWKQRSETYAGVATAMAHQWAPVLLAA